MGDVTTATPPRKRRKRAHDVVAETKGNKSASRPSRALRQRVAGWNSAQRRRPRRREDSLGSLRLSARASLGIATSPLVPRNDRAWDPIANSSSSTHDSHPFPPCREAFLASNSASQHLWAAAAGKNSLFHLSLLIAIAPRGALPSARRSTLGHVSDMYALRRKPLRRCEACSIASALPGC